jgi:hypothetical protein
LIHSTGKSEKRRKLWDLLPMAFSHAQAVKIAEELLTRKAVDNYLGDLLGAGVVDRTATGAYEKKVQHTFKK